MKEGCRRVDLMHPPLIDGTQDRCSQKVVGNPWSSVRCVVAPERAGERVDGVTFPMLIHLLCMTFNSMFVCMVSVSDGRVVSFEVSAA